MNFKLDERLEADSVFVARLENCQVRVCTDKRYPWLILIPEVSDIADIDELSWSDQIQVLKASNLISKLMKTLYKPDKMNVASLGNIVNQLHIHHVCRYTTDETWPGPIWGQGTKDVYTPSQIESTILELKTALQQFYKGEKHDNNHDK